MATHEYLIIDRGRQHLMTTGGLWRALPLDDEDMDDLLRFATREEARKFQADCMAKGITVEVFASEKGA